MITRTGRQLVKLADAYEELRHALMYYRDHAEADENSPAIPKALLLGPVQDSVFSKLQKTLRKYTKPEYYLNRDRIHHLYERRMKTNNKTTADDVVRRLKSITAGNDTFYARAANVSEGRRPDTLISPGNNISIFGIIEPSKAGHVSFVTSYPVQNRRLFKRILPDD